MARWPEDYCRGDAGERGELLVSVYTDREALEDGLLVGTTGLARARNGKFVNRVTRTVWDAFAEELALLSTIRFLRKMFEIEQLTPRHNEISPWKQCAREETNQSGRIFDGRFGQEPTTVLSLRDNEIAYEDITKDAGTDGVWLVPNRDLSVALEVNQFKKPHHGLANSEIL